MSLFLQKDTRNFVPGTDGPENSSPYDGPIRAVKPGEENKGPAYNGPNPEDSAKKVSWSSGKKKKGALKRLP